MQDSHDITHVDTLVIGGGQAGLAVGYHLARRGIDYRIVDAQARIGDSWRNRWDSLRLFTPARFAGLDGMRFPGAPDAFPTKDEMAAYLVSYARRFGLVIENGVRVERLERQGDGFVATARRRRFVARNVVVAMANYQAPVVPAFAGMLDPAIRQVHAHAYRGPAQLADGGVLVVGVGNSGADIALETARSGHATWLAGHESGAVPFDIESPLARAVLFRAVRFVGHNVLSVDTPMGRRARPGMLHRAAPLVRVRPVVLARAGVVRVPRVTGVAAGQPVLADGRALAVSNVIWCTGYRPDFGWIRLPVFEPDGLPRHASGIVAEAPGLYFVGLHFLHAMSSATLIGVSRDAARVAEAIARRSKTGRPTGRARRFWPRGRRAPGDAIPNSL